MLTVGSHYDSIFITLDFDVVVYCECFFVSMYLNVGTYKDI